jgi:Xaa-Pro aminopeptidase
MRSLEAARAAIRPGVPARELFDLACEVLEGAGCLTQRTATRPDETEGFQFALGHGVGLWDKDIGEIRFEDLVLVTESGCETLTDFPYGLTPGG